MSAEHLPGLVDRKSLANELGVGRSTEDAIFRAVPVVAIPGLRKPMVRREDVARLIAKYTYVGDRVRPG
jgi:hypothetical protein